MEFRVESLEDICLLVVDCPHSTPRWTDDGYLVIRNHNIRNGRLNFASRSFTDREHFLNRIRRAKPQPGDIIITREAPMGEVAMIPPGLECCLGQRQVLLRPDPKKVHGRFLLYALQSPYVQHQIHWNEGSGSTVSNLRIPVLKALKVMLPPLRVQVAIAETLGAMDDRIDLLEQTNSTLESIVQAIFKSWFVDFDPVHAKAEGREPEGLDAETAELFPSEFDNSELGPIPRGWRVGTLGEVLRNRVSRVKPSEDTVRLPYVPIECITTKSVFLRQMLPGERAKSSLTFFREGDILFGAMRPYFHKVCIAPFDGVTRTTVLVLEPRDSYQAFALFQMFDESTIAYAVSNSEGSTIPYVKWAGSLETKPIIIPPENVAQAYGALVAPLLRKGNHNSAMAHTLAELRDTLLPRLLSGKLRVPEASDLIREVAS